MWNLNFKAEFRIEILNFSSEYNSHIFDNFNLNFEFKFWNENFELEF